jgi:outer membrane cobalamin receptor
MTSLLVTLLLVASQVPIRETVVVTGQAAPEPFENVSRAVTVITRDEIARLPVRSVAEILQYLASVDVQSRGALGVQSDFSVRGASFGRTLVLVDGVRLNDAQSGHHNADIPIPLDHVERIEVLYGQGSSLYGADAFGGTVNVITRRPSAGRPRLTVSAGESGYVDGGFSFDAVGSSLAQSVSLAASRSSGFMPARDFETLWVSSRTTFGETGGLLVSHLWKDFGANGFYGPAPSRERTNQTLLSYSRRLLRRDRGEAALVTSYRTHGDWFLYDPRSAASVPNRHRTHAVEATLKAQRTLSSTLRLNAGATAGGDWIRSSNLGDHAFARGSVFAEFQQRLGSRTLLYPGIRVDAYSNFGMSAAPSLAITSWLSPHVKVRASAGRAFRVPTFTELYYRDPNHLATPTLVPEHAWEAEAGFDWLPGTDWQGSASVFARRESDVIDWIRSSPLVRWQTTNIRRVAVRGMEGGVARRVGETGRLRLDYTFLSADAGAVDFLSKYVLDFARHKLTGSASLALPEGFGLGQRVAYTRRADRRAYWLVDTRLSKRVGAADVFVEGTNLLDTGYQEVIGVEMPGRWFRAGVAVVPF